MTTEPRYDKVLTFASADPFHEGHAAMLRAAAHLGKKVVFSVMTDPTRTYAIPHAKRVRLAQKCVEESKLADLVEVTSPPEGARHDAISELVRTRCQGVARAARPGEQWRELDRMRVETTVFPWLKDRWHLVKPEGSPEALAVSGTAVRAAVAQGGWVSEEACSERAQVLLRSEIRKEKRVGVLGTRAQFGELVSRCAAEAARAGRVPAVRGAHWVEVLAWSDDLPEPGCTPHHLLLGSMWYEWGRGINIVFLGEGCAEQCGEHAALALAGWDVIVLDGSKTYESVASRPEVWVRFCTIDQAAHYVSTLR